MVFSSLTFICVFLPLVVAFYFALPKAANNLILVVASYVFYAWGDPVALLLIVPSVAMNFQFGRFIDSASGVRRRQFVAAAVAINLTILVVFKYSDFILELDFKVDPTLNSGVQIRSQWFEEPKTVELGGKTIKIPAGRVHGYQVEIDPSDRAWTGGIYDEGRRGWLGDLKNNEPARKAFKQSEWNLLRIECKGDSIKTWLNGVPAADPKDGITPSGFIALQVHAVKTNDPLEVRFRQLRIRELK